MTHNFKDVKKADKKMEARDMADKKIADKKIVEKKMADTKMAASDVRTYGSNQFTSRRWLPATLEHTVLTNLRAHQHQFAPELYQRTPRLHQLTRERLSFLEERNNIH